MCCYLRYTDGRQDHRVPNAAVNPVYFNSVLFKAQQICLLFPPKSGKVYLGMVQVDEFKIVIKQLIMYKGMNIGIIVLNHPPWGKR